MPGNPGGVDEKGVLAFQLSYACIASTSDETESE
jgi:hypothetical protein